jgi:uncharacterized alpha-E superfamily protein
VLARIAHELFWLGRYLARAEHTARMLDGVFHADLQGRPDDPGVLLSWDALLAIMGAASQDGEGERRTREEVIRLLTAESGNPTSVLSCVESARERARTVRDVISAEMWEVVNTSRLGLRQQDLAASLRTEPYAIFQYVKERCALFWGLASRTMLKDDAQAFLQAGGRIESADMVLRMLRVALPPAPESDDDPAEGSGRRAGQALALLRAVGGMQAFRRAVPAPPNAEPVIRFLLFEREYPDSVAASVDALHAALSVADQNYRNAAPVLRLGRLSADLEFRGRAAGAAEIARTLRIVQDELAETDREIAQRYFAGAPAGREAVPA